MKMNRTSDITTFEPVVGQGADVNSTEMLKGKGKFSKDQLADNVTQPYATGAAKDSAPHGGMARHPGGKSSTS